MRPVVAAAPAAGATIVLPPLLLLPLLLLLQKSFNFLDIDIDVLPASSSKHTSLQFKVWLCQLSSKNVLHELRVNISW